MFTFRGKVIQKQQLMLEKPEGCSVLPPPSWSTNTLLRFIRSSQSQQSPQHKLRAQHCQGKAWTNNPRLSLPSRALPPFPNPSLHFIVTFPSPRG